PYGGRPSLAAATEWVKQVWSGSDGSVATRRTASPRSGTSGVSSGGNTTSCAPAARRITPHLPGLCARVRPNVACAGCAGVASRPHRPAFRAHSAERRQRAEGPAAMAEGVLRVAVEFPEATTDAGHTEQRVVPEAARARGRVQDASGRRAQRDD